MAINADVIAIHNWVFQLATAPKMLDVYGCVKQLDDMDQRDLFLEIVTTKPRKLNANPAAVASLRGRLETMAKNPIYIPGPKSFWSSLIKGIQNIFGRTSSEKLRQAIYMHVGDKLSDNLTLSMYGLSGYKMSSRKPSTDELEYFAKQFNQLNLITNDCKDLENLCNAKRKQVTSAVRNYYGVAFGLDEIRQADFAVDKMSTEVFRFISNHLCPY